MIDTAPGYKLSRADVRALQQAPTLLFFHEENSNQGSIVALWDSITTSERHEEKRVSFSCCSKIRKGYATRDTEFSRAFLSLYRQGSSYANTFARFIRGDDVISLDWRPDAHTNENCRRAGLHADVLSVVIMRPRMSRGIPIGYHRFVFDFPAPICPDNTARMVRH